MERGGRALSQEELNKLLAERDALLKQLGDLMGVVLDENTIISQMNMSEDITIESSTKNKGIRHGFYQSDDALLKRKNR